MRPLQGGLRGKQQLWFRQQFSDGFENEASDDSTWDDSTWDASTVDCCDRG